MLIGPMKSGQVVLVDGSVAEVKAGDKLYTTGDGWTKQVRNDKVIRYFGSTYTNQVIALVDERVQAQDLAPTTLCDRLKKAIEDWHSAEQKADVLHQELSEIADLLSKEGF